MPDEEVDRKLFLLFNDKSKILHTEYTDAVRSTRNSPEEYILLLVIVFQVSTIFQYNFRFCYKSIFWAVVNLILYFTEKQFEVPPIYNNRFFSRTVFQCHSTCLYCIVGVQPLLFQSTTSTTLKSTIVFFHVLYSYSAAQLTYTVLLECKPVLFQFTYHACIFLLTLFFQCRSVYIYCILCR